MRRISAWLFTIFLAFVGVGIAPAHATAYDIIYDLGDGCSAARLPSEYTELEYIRSSGSQYIDSGIKVDFSKDFRVVGKVWNPSTFYRKVVVGSYYNGSDKSYGIEFGGSSNNYPGYLRNWVASGGSNSSQWSSSTLPANTEISYDVDYNATNHTIENTLTYGNSNRSYTVNVMTVTGSADRSLRFFLDYRSSTSGIAYPVSIGETKMYKDNQLVGHFIPAKQNSDNTLGMYDLVSGTFKEKGGSGSFQAGDPVSSGTICTNYSNAPTTYTYATGATINGVPTKVGSVFAGWCTDSGLQNCAMSQTIGTEATGAKTFYAKWCTACAATNASCSLSVVNNVCTYTTSCDDGYYIQNNGTYNASCSECGGNYYYCTGGTRNHVTAGYYSTGGTETTRTGQSQCASGYYCSSGVQNECPTGYGNSVAGATDQAQCYKPCTTADVEHSATVIGNNYYGTNGNMCEAETCVSGSHAKPGTNPNLERIIGDSVGTVESLSGSYAGTFTISYGEKGTITGSSSCSSANSQSICNCTLNSYTPQNGSQQTLGAPSMRFTSYRGSNYEYECFNNCLSICANRIAQNTTQRTQLFRSITDRLTTCEIETYNITYTMNGGTNYENAPETYIYTTGATLNGVPTKANNVFVGWTGDNGDTPQMTVTIGTDATGAKSYTANWSECQACAATHATCSLSVVNNVCTYTTTCDTNYGNMQHSGEYNASCSPNSYAITYTMNGGTNYDNAPAAYIYTTGATLNGVPTKANNVFVGWTGDNGNTPQMSVTIGADATGAKSYTANWSECTACSATNATCSFDGVVNNACTYTTTCNSGYGNIQNNGAYNASCSELVSYTVTYSCGDGTGTPPAEDTVFGGESFTPAANTGCTNGDYIFAGWAVSGTEDIKQSGVAFNWGYTNNKTFTAQWRDPGFVITTTSINSGATFKFDISASGTFVVDCGDGGTLSGTGVSGDTITRNDTTKATYTCTYSTTGVKNITIGGRATGYATSAAANSAAISFTNNSASRVLIKSVSGSMGSVFPTLNNGANTSDIPIFYSTFQQCSNLETVSANLFDGVTGSRDSMFRSTFDKCTKLEEIPYGLFSGASGGAANMFRSTFYECSSLPGIPEDLFAGVTSADDSMFKYTFHNCTGMTGSYIPPSTFSGLIAITPRPIDTDMWSNTFGGTNTLLTECPSGTVAYHTGYDKYSATDYWNSKVSCECDGGHYLSNGTCVTCPTGYTDGATTGKTSESQCQISCAAGTYLANVNDTTCTDVGLGYWAAASDINYGDTGTRTPCENGWTTANANGTSAAACSVPTVQCEGATYFDSGTEQCVPCPTGYTADTTSGKISINQCKIHCNAGTYIANANDTTCTDVGIGYYAPAADIAYGDSETHTQCPENATTLNTHSASIDACLCTGARYMNNGVCVACPTGYTADTTDGKTSESQCKIHCDAGTYLANANDTTCTNVGQGYWAAASDVGYGSTGSRTQCASGTSTVGNNGTSAASCVDISLSCTGATYWDSTAGECVACPNGYNSNTTAGKTSINQCQKRCTAGKWLDTFTPVEYLQGNGSTTFIDTGYNVQSNNVSVNMVLGSDRNVASGVNYGNFFGNIYKSSTGNKGFSGGYKNGVFGFWSDKAGKKAQVSKSFELNKQYTFAGTMNTTSIGLNISDTNGTSSGSYTCSNATNTAGNTLKLFTNGGAVNNNGTIEQLGTTYGDQLFPGRIYSFELYDGSDKVLDLIPVRRNSDNALGMFDKLTETFYPNAGTGTFTAGTPDTSATFGACENVGDGYYNGATITNYGSNGTRHQCPNNTVTNKENATSLHECVGLTVYDCDPGEYMPANGNACATCTTGNYCVGGEFISTDAAQGLTACSTVGDSSYTSSATGASSENDCYKACSTSSVEHSSTVSGNDYYGTGVDTCAATACESGYELSVEVPGTCEESQTPSYTVTYSCNGGVGDAPANASIVSNESFTPAANTCTRTGYIFTGWGVSNTGTPGDTRAAGTAFTWEYTENKTFAAQWSECAACAATNASCTFDGVVNNVCTYTTACNTGYGNIQNNGAYNASCTGNLITINWNDANGDLFESGSCTYGGAITTPTLAPVKRGYTFTGWRFSLPQS